MSTAGAPGTDAPARRAGPEIRALVAVGDEALARMVELTLRHGSYARRSAASVNEALTAIEEWRPHLVIVDIDLEGGLGMQLVEEVGGRERMAAIALTRRSDLRGKLDAFERGADDYIGVPFVPDDLIARAHAVVRRVHGGAGGVVPRLQIGDLVIDVLNRRVRAGDTELHLTSLEQALLYLLAANAGTILTREQILDALWGTDSASESNVVDRHVRALRAKLQDDWRKPRYIQTVSGVGYRFITIEAP